MARNKILKPFNYKESTNQKKITLRRKRYSMNHVRNQVLSSPVYLDCSHLITSKPNKMIVYLMQTVKIMDL